MSDTEVAREAKPEFDPDAVFVQAQAQADRIKSEIEYQKQAKLNADVRIRDLREKLTKTERILGAMTPRTRKPKEASAKVLNSKVLNSKVPNSKKPAATA